MCSNYGKRRMPSKKKNSKNEKARTSSGAEEKKDSKPEAELKNSDLLKTKGKEAFKKIANLALDGELDKKPELIRCLIFLAEHWAKDARRKLETASDFEATLADIARRAAEKYDRKCKKRGSGKGG